MSTQITIKPSTHVLIMGVSGCGKSSVARNLSKQFALPFLEGDDFHPQANIDKMQAGYALNDEDRLPWLESLNQEMINNPAGSVLACSALKSKYREILSLDLDDFIIVFLKGSFDLIRKRMMERKDHFMPIDLLRSQFDTLEEPDHCIMIDITKSVDEITEEIISKMKIVE